MASILDGSNNLLSASVKQQHLEDSSSLSLFQKSNPETFQFDTLRHRGPDSFFFFGILFSYHDPVVSYFLSQPSAAGCSTHMDSCPSATRLGMDAASSDPISIWS
jgi:hypothetical protein